MKKRRRAAPSGEPTTDALHRVIERQLDMLRSYKMRQDDIVRGLGAIQNMIGSAVPASVLIADLMSRDLKQAKDRCDNFTFALSMAIKTLERYTSHRDVVDVLSQLEILVPDAFEKVAV